MREVKQTHGWGGVCHALLTLILIPQLTSGLPMRSTRFVFAMNSNAPPRSLEERSTVSSPYSTLAKFTARDIVHTKNQTGSILSKELNHSGGFTSEVNRVKITLSYSTQNWPTQKKLRAYERDVEKSILVRQKRTLSLNGSNPAPFLLRNRTGPTWITTPEAIPHQDVTNSVPSSKWAEDRNIVDRIKSNFIRNYQGQNNSLQYTPNSEGADTNMSDSSLHSLPLSDVEDIDLRINRTNNSLLVSGEDVFVNGSLRMNISEFLSRRRCRNVSGLSQDGAWRDRTNNTRSERHRRTPGEEGCQVLHRQFGYLRVGPNGEVGNVWTDVDEYTWLHIFAIGPSYVRIKGIRANRYIHMDEAGAVAGIPARDIPDPYDSSDSTGAWIERPFIDNRVWVTWHVERGPSGHKQQMYLAFNVRGVQVRPSVAYNPSRRAHFMKTLSAGSSCNPNDGGYTRT